MFPASGLENWAWPYLENPVWRVGSVELGPAQQSRCQFVVCGVALSALAMHWHLLLGSALSVLDKAIGRSTTEARTAVPVRKVFAYQQVPVRSLAFATQLAFEQEV